MSSRALKYRTKRGSKLAADTPPPGAKDPAAMDAKNAMNGEPHEDKSTEANNSGDGNKSEAVTDAQTLDAIKKEGLTGRQLRMARRIAQKNGLAPTSDFDAVRLLRTKGIDPFERSNVLQITERAPDAQVPALEAKPRLEVDQDSLLIPSPSKNRSRCLPPTARGHLLRRSPTGLVRAAWRPRHGVAAGRRTSPICTLRCD